MKKTKKHPPILMLIDIMMLIVFMYITSPVGDIKSDLYINFEDGIIDGSIVEKKHTDTDDVIYYRITNELLTEISLDKSEIAEKISCASSACLSIVQRIYDRNYEFWITLPKSIMDSGNSLIYKMCKQTKCNGVLYLHAKSGKSSICGQNSHYYSMQKNNLLKGKKCQFNG